MYRGRGGGRGRGEGGWSVEGGEIKEKGEEGIKKWVGTRRRG